jgi:hypothetical protein
MVVNLVRGLFALGVSIVLGGCAALSPPPDIPAYSVAPGARVGLLLAISPIASHEHVGTTIFNNFSAEQHFPWSLPDRVHANFVQALQKAGYEVVELDPAKFKAQSLANLLVQNDRHWTVPAEEAQDFAALRQDMHLAALIVVQSTPTLVNRECTQYGCTDRVAQNSGLFTRSMLFITNWYAVPAIATAVYNIDPPIRLSAYEPLAGIAEHKVKLLRDVKDPKDFNILTDEEFAPVSNWIAEYAQLVANASVQQISGNAGKPR